MNRIERHLGKFLSVFILIAAGLLVLFANDLRLTLSFDTSPPPSAAVTHPASAVEELQKLKPKAHYDLIANRNLFVFPETTGSNESAKKAKAQPVKETDLIVRLKGTIVSPSGFALAMIEDRAQRNEDLYMVGDRIQEAEILEIRKDRIILRHSGRDETLTLFTEQPKTEAGPRKAARPRGAASKSPPAPTRSTPSSDVSDNRRAQQKVRSLMAQLRLRPHYEKGKPAGFKVGQVTQGSVFQAQGLKEGDIIVAINDEDVRTPNQLLKAYREAAEDEEIWLDIIRDGEEDSVEVDLEEIIGSD